jgi:hypothetical protein
MPTTWNFDTTIPFEIATKDILEEMWRNGDVDVMREWTLVEIQHLPDNAIWLAFDRLLPDDVCDILYPHITPEVSEIEIEINCQGSFYPGVWYTHNGDGYPDEWDEERLVTAITIGDKTFTSKDKEFDLLANIFYDDIDELELDSSLYEPDEPEPDLEDYLR